MQYNLFSLLALWPLAVLASPAAVRSVPQEQYPAVASRLALSIATINAQPTAASDASENEAAVPTQGPGHAQVNAAMAARMTITFKNSHGDAISTVHVRDPSAPGPVSGNTAPGKMADGSSAVVVFPPGWIGNIAVNDGAYSDTTGDESLIEANFVNSKGTINVSYVNGFSAAITCKCNENNIYVGCNKNLYSLHKCNTSNGQNSCRNPSRNKDNGPADVFFAPCHGKGGAYTYPKDDNANQLTWKCPSEQYTCCVGSKCPPNPNQAHW